MLASHVADVCSWRYRISNKHKIEAQAAPLAYRKLLEFVSDVPLVILGVHLRMFGTVSRHSTHVQKKQCSPRPRCSNSLDLAASICIDLGLPLRSCCCWRACSVGPSWSDPSAWRAAAHSPWASRRKKKQKYLFSP